MRSCLRDNQLFLSPRTGIRAEIVPEIPFEPGNGLGDFAGSLQGIQRKIGVVPLDRPDNDSIVVAPDIDAIRRDFEPRLNCILRSRGRCLPPHAVCPNEKASQCRDRRFGVEVRFGWIFRKYTDKTGRDKASLQ